MSSKSVLYFINILCNNDKRYRIQTLWQDNNFNLTLIDNFAAYNSNVTEDILKCLAVKYEKEFDDYVEELRCSLSQKDTSYIYNKNFNKLTISKYHDNITVQLADFELNEIDFNNSVLNIIDEINDYNLTYQNELINAKKQLEISDHEKNKCLQKLEDFVNEKNNMEHELYSKFILILNEKKMRIQYLQELIKLYRKENGKLLDDLEEKLTTRREIISDSETDSSIDEPAEKITHEVQIECVNIISKKKQDFLNDEDNIITSINLPKRLKFSKADEVITLDNSKVIAEEEIPKCSETMTENGNEENSDIEESLNFNTQDLVDRL